MYQCGDRVLYGVHGVCLVTALDERIVDRKRVQYYVLEPAEQLGSKYYVPTHNQAAVSKLRPVMTAQQLEVLLHSEDVRRDVWITDESQRKSVYRELINSGDRASLLAMIRALHKHKELQAAAGKKFHLCDENFLRDAEKLLSAEFSLVLGIDRSEVGRYIENVLTEE